MKTGLTKVRKRSVPWWLLLLSSSHLLLLSMSYYAFCGEYPIKDPGINALVSLAALLLVMWFPSGKRLPILLRKHPWRSCVVCCAACVAVIGVTEYFHFRSNFLWCFVALNLALLVYALWDENEFGTIGYNPSYCCALLDCILLYSALSIRRSSYIFVC